MTRFKLLALLGVAFALSPSTLAAPDAAASPDQMAWGVFAQLVAPASTPRVKAVAFETWASDDDIYASNPPHWPTHGIKILRRSLAAVAEVRALHGTPAPNCLPKDGRAGNFPPNACIGEEVQHNRPVYDTIVARGLFTTAGLKASYAGPAIDFPKDSIVVKADWVMVSDILLWLPDAYKSADQVRRAYYTNVATMNGRTGEYALVGMSVQSKAMPHWLWMTFEHRSNLGRCDIIGCHDDFGAVDPDVASRAAPNTDYGPCAKTAALQALFAAKKIDPIWNNYCLKGTQTEFVVAGGPTILANSVIERMNKGVAVPNTSCITCHAYASFNNAGTPNYAVLPRHPTGGLIVSYFHGYKTHDYLWSVLAAH